MCDIWMDVDTALAEVPVNIMPLIDDTDFKTREVAIAFDAAGMDLVWNFVTTGGAMTQTAVTPTSAGNYDWAHQGDGMYSIEIPASGGASINNDTEGFGWFTGLVTGVLPWRGPVIGFRAAALNNSLIDGATIDVNVTALGGVTQSLTDLKDFADDGYDPATNKVQGVVLTDTVTTYTGNTPQTGDSFARIGATGSGLTTLATQASVNTIDDFLDTEIAAIITTLGTPAGASISADIAAIEAQTDDIGAAGAGLTAVPWNAAWDAEVQSEVQDALEANNLDHLAGTATGIPAIPAGTYIDQMMDDGTAVYDRTTDSLQAIRDRGDAAWVTGTTPPTVGAIADAVWDETLADHLGAGSTGAGLNAAGAAGDPWSTALPGAYGAGTGGFIVGTNINATISSRASQASVDTVDTVVDAILADTGTDGVVVAAASKTGYALSAAGVQAFWDALTAALTTVGSIGKLFVDNINATISSRLASASYTTPPTANENADALLDRASGVEVGLTPRQAMRLIAAATAGKLSGAATVTVTIRNAVADDANRITATVDADGNRTAIVYNL